MVAGIYNITIEQGATFERLLTVREPDTSLKNLTGYQARMQIRREHDSASFDLELTDGNGRIELGGALGTVKLIIASTDTAALTRGGVYDLELIASGGTVERLIKGRVTLDAEVTR